MALIHWIEREGPGNLGVMACPGRTDQLENDLQKAKDEGVEELICLLTPQEIADKELESERETAERLGMNFKMFPIRDHDVPPADVGTHDFLEARLHDLRNGRTVVFHCSSARGRTSLMAASLLVMEGMDPNEAMKHVRGRRWTTVPDDESQMEWVRDLSARLGRPAPPKTQRSYLKLAAAVGVAIVLAAGAWTWQRRRA